ncbi:hypothetical protein ACRALDRAFT_1059936, partial [Sodiomyces alcalophilus JCM 7366]|uniref:uncharacterized protein n=1 Tax=Sodiomyces alcalophilus JCM 7366 TaxID=591952 RepID=UPI0039B5C0F8
MASSSRVTHPVVIPEAEPDRAEEPQSPQNPLCQALLDQYYRELAKGGVKASSINKELWGIQSPNELVAQIAALEHVRSMGQLQPVLFGLSDFFAALSAWALALDDAL